MRNLYDYRIFISHAWSYGNDSAHLVSLLDNAPLFSYYNYSAPREKPLFPPGTPYTSYDIARKITNKIQPAQLTIVLSGMYAAYSDWIKNEIDESVRMGMPVNVDVHADSSGFRPISKIMQLKWLTGTQLPLFQLFVAMCDSL